MTAEVSQPSEKGANPRKGILSAALAARISGVKRQSTRVVLAFPGFSHGPFTLGHIALMARNAAILGEIMAPGSSVDAWIYTSRPHRLPELRLPQATEWITDWAALPRKSLLSRDAAPANLLAQHAERYGLFDDEDVVAAIRGIAQSLRAEDGPTLVLFYTWALTSKGPGLADQLEAESGKDVFWQFVGNSSFGSSVLDDLDGLRAEAPHISNVNLYEGWESLQGTPRYFFFRGVLKPFARWRKARSRTTS